MYDAEGFLAEKARLEERARLFGELAGTYDETGEILPMNGGAGERHACLDPECSEEPKGIQGMTRHVRAAHPRISERKLDAWREEMRGQHLAM